MDVVAEAIAMLVDDVDANQARQWNLLRDLQIRPTLRIKKFLENHLMN